VAGGLPHSPNDLLAHWHGVPEQWHRRLQSWPPRRSISVSLSNEARRWDRSARIASTVTGETVAYRISLHQRARVRGTGMAEYSK